jgi:two-component system sensor histidine kinase KdpD
VVLDELVHDRLRRLRRLFRDIHLEVEISEGLPLLDADYSQLDQVLTNLLENAARYAPPGSVVTVGAGEKGEVVEIWVSDEGTGIDPDDVGHLFEPFRRGAASESSGVGLAICKAIVEAHGGSIEVRPTLRQGAVFVFTMPIRRG